ncbi:MAG: biotin/lipoyl-binding protein, partial [Candidatus Vogelbacteria bacterium]|nr:biotin/lipoyl-binding protein [Candidatus Vogelbacteria bacterium]
MRNLWTKIKGQLHWSKIKNYALGHKIISVIIIVVVIFAGYKVYSYFTNTSGQTRYVVAVVEKGTVIATVSGSGQVSASSQVELKPKASGDIVYIGTKSGQTVGQGQLLLQLDARDALLNLENAKLALAKLTKPADKLSIIQAENALASAIDTGNQAYSSGFNSMDAAFLDLPTVMTGLETLFTNYNASTYFTNEASLSDTAKIYRQTASASYYRAKTAYDKNVTDYRGVGRTAASSTMQVLVVETAQTAKLVAQALKETNTAISFIINQTDSRNKTTAMTTDTANINTWTTEMNSHVTSLNSIADTLSSSARTIADKQESLVKLQEGADKLDIRSQELAVEQKQNTYNDYFIRAPFAG